MASPAALAPPASGKSSFRFFPARLLPFAFCLLCAAASTTGALAQTLVEALDAPELTWTTGGDLPWAGQTFMTHDGVDAAQSGAITHNQSSWMETTVTGPGTVVFWWKVSSQPGSFPDLGDALKFEVVGGSSTSVSGAGDWERKVMPIPAGERTLRWSYNKNAEDTAGADAGWVDQVVYVGTNALDNAHLSGLSLSTGTLSPTFFLTTTSYLAGVSNATDSITVTPVKSGPNATIEVRVNGGGYAEVESGNPSASLPLNVGANTVEVRVTAEDGVTTKIYTVTVTRADLFDPLAQALDAPELVWVSGGNQPWLAQTTTTHDGVDAAQSGSIGDNEESWLETTVTGPGLLTFWWRVSSHFSDSLEFRIVGGSSSSAISGASSWAQRTVSVPAGTQTLRWRYYKDGDSSTGADAGWVDEVSYIGANAPDNAYLSGLSLSDGTLNPAFSLTTTSYTASVLNETDSITVTPVKMGTNATIEARVNGGGFTEVESGSPSASLALNVGANTVEVRVTAADGVTTKTYAVTVTRMTPALPLDEALDTTGLIWTSGGNLPWFGQSATTHDGVDAAQSGGITHNQESWVETTVTGPGTLTFWWRVSSENFFDRLRFLIDGGEQQTISGNVDWAQVTVPIAAGSHALRWRYTKDGSDSAGADTGWLDEVSFVATDPASNANLTSLALSSGTLNPAFAAATTSYTANVSNATDSITVTPVKEAANATIEAQVNGGGFIEVESGSPSAALPLNVGANTVEVRVTAQDGVTTKTYAVTVTRSLPLAEVLDGTGLTWTSGGNQAWFGQVITTHDGVDAAQSGSITHSQQSWVETTVTGPGTVTFWWKVSSETNWDRLWFLIDGAQQQNITGNVDWTQVSVPIAAGNHTLRWSYIKDEIVSAGADTGWLDEVSFTPSGPSANANLSALALSSGTLSPDFDPATTSYTASVHNVTASITALALKAEANATLELRINDGSFSPLESGSESAVLPLNVGANTVEVRVTAADGVTTKTYAVTVTRQSPPVALAEALDGTGLTWTSGGDQVWFGQGTTTHDGVDAAQSGGIGDDEESWVQTTVTGPGTLTFWWKVSSEEDADTLDFSIDSEVQQSISGEVGWTEVSVPIAEGSHTLRWRYIKDFIFEEGEDAGWLDEVSYVGEGPSANANLAALVLSSGTLSPAFDPATTSYTASVGNATASLTVTPTVEDAEAAIEARVNGGSFAPVGSGSPSGALALNAGANTVEVRVTAEDGVTTQTYTVTVTRTAVDKVKPVVKITDPQGGKVTGAFTLSGTVKENIELASFTVTLNGEPLALDAPLVLTPNAVVSWSVSVVPPENGNNVVLVEAVDVSGNRGTAKKTLAFVSNRPELAGIYHALLVATGAPGNDTTGLITVKATATGAFSGKTLLGGVSKSFSGVLKNDGSARFKPAWGESFGLFRKTVKLGDIGFNVSDPSGLIGTLTGPDEDVLAVFAGVPAPYSTKNLVPGSFLNQPVTGTPSKGFYTVIFPSKEQTPPADTDTYPQGDGFATLTLSKAGAVTLAGRLADGVKYTAKSVLRADGTTPLFTPLYSKLGAFAGELAFDDLADTDVGGNDLLWLRPLQTKQKHYPDGWPAGIRVDAVGAKYARPASLDFGQGAADLVNGNASLNFIDGLLGAPVSKPVSVDPATGAVKLPAGDKTFKLSLKAATGLLSGSFTHTDARKPGFSGILLNKGANQGGFGYFLSTPAAGATGESGGVFLDPEGPSP